MLLSIVIPVFDAQRYVVRLLDSILTAGYDPSLVEIVLVDDGSNDASVDRIVGWMRTHDDVVARLVRQDNGGVSRARNNGLDHAEGEYVWFVDADDMLPSGGGVLHSGQEQTPSQKRLVLCRQTEDAA